MLRFTAIVQSLKSIGGETLGMSLLDGHKLPVTDIFPIDASYYFQDVYFLVCSLTNTSTQQSAKVTNLFLM